MSIRRNCIRGALGVRGHEDQRHPSGAYWGSTKLTYAVERSEARKTRPCRRTRKLDVLEKPDNEERNAPSLCAGWRVRDAVVHLLTPYPLTVPGFLGNCGRWIQVFQPAPTQWLAC